MCPLPALERYDGNHYRVLQRVLHACSEHDAWDRLSDWLDVLIISAEFGLLEPDERLALHIYQRRYRRASRAVLHLLGYPYDGPEAGLHTLADHVMMVAFRPLEAHTDHIGVRHHSDW